MPIPNHEHILYSPHLPDEKKIKKISMQTLLITIRKKYSRKRSLLSRN